LPNNIVKEIIMLTEYIHKAMEMAKYEIIEDDHTYWGEIPGFKGVWGRAKTLEECREELRETLEEWIVFRLKNQLELPENQKDEWLSV
jgi:predicted RNase H-like HicB family nuclease